MQKQWCDNYVNNFCQPSQANIGFFHHIRHNMPQEENSGVTGLSQARLDALSDAPQCSQGAVHSLPPSKATPSRTCHPHLYLPVLVCCRGWGAAKPCSSNWPNQLHISCSLFPVNQSSYLPAVASRDLPLKTCLWANTSPPPLWTQTASHGTVSNELNVLHRLPRTCSVLSPSPTWLIFNMSRAFQFPSLWQETRNFKCVWSSLFSKISPPSSAADKAQRPDPSG